MKRIFRLIGIVLVAAIAALSFAGCDLNKAGGNLTGYTINAVYNEEEKTLTAEMKVSYYNSSETEMENVMFNLYPNAYRQSSQFSPVSDGDIDKAYPDGISYGDISIIRVKAAGKEVETKIGGADSNILTVELAEKLKPTKRVEINIEFIVKLAHVKHRLGYYNKTVNLGNWYPVACVFEDGGFVACPYYSVGDPFYSDIADYDVKISAPVKYTAAATGDTQSTTLSQDGTSMITAFKAGSVRDFAMVLGEFSVVNSTVGKTKINYYYYDDAKFEENLKTAEDALLTFNNMFGEYPYKTLSVAKTSFLMGGMEYPMLVYISDSLNEDIFKEVIVHEISHQWWACAVGNNQVKHAWLDEALAEYSTTLFYDANPSYGITSRLRIADALSSYMLYCEMYKNNGKDDTSMNRELKDYSGQLEYSFMSYVKGQIMLDSLHNMIGDAPFKKALKEYYKNNKFKIATPESLIGEFERASSRELLNYFNSWIEGKVQMYN